MKIINKTDYDTIALRKIFTEVIRRDNKHEGKIPSLSMRLMHVYINYQKTDDRYYRGRAKVGLDYGIPFIKLWIPRRDPDPRYIASLFEHEFHHVRGYEHSAYTKSERKGLLIEPFEWASAYSIPVKDKKEKPKKDHVRTRFDHAVKMLDKYEHALARTLKLAKKWKKKVDYYEKKYSLERR